MDTPQPDDSTDPNFQAPDPTDTPLRDVSDSVSARSEGSGEGQFRATEGSRIQCLTCR